jgi:glutamate carboxypeptidase
MVGINSFTTNREGVNELGLLTAECFASLGFKAEQVPSMETSHGSHLFLERGDRSKKPLLLVTHLDTVFPPEEELVNNFRWMVAASENRIYGPGTVDIKGGTVLIWMMLHAMKELLPDAYESTHWLIAANSAEEVMSTDFARCVNERCLGGAQAVLVFEGGPREGEEWHIVTSRKGRAEYRLDAVGKAAHAGSSHAAGANAIVGLCGPVKAAAALTNYDDDLTVNIGCIGGGTALNRVPHEAFAELEMRAFDPAVLDRAGDAVMSLAGLTPEGVAIEVTRLGRSPAWKEDMANAALASLWHDAAKSVGRALKSVPRGGLSDANYLCHLGPTLDGLGPSGANAHCSERCADGSKVPEYVEPDSFVPKAVINVLAICELLKAH